MSTTEFKSSPARLARLFRRSRDTWKRRAAAKQRVLKKLRITVRDLTASRDHWKAIAHQQAETIAALRKELDQPRETPCLGGF
jgi:hypothetical protein